MRAVFHLFIIIVLSAMSWQECAFAEPTSEYVRKSEGCDIAIIFVHGVLGDSVDTWTNGNNYWPKMLTQDSTFDGADIFVYGYPTSFWSRLSIDELAENMRLVMSANGVTSHRTLVFLAHSMGGLVLRAYLLRNKEAANRTKFAYFFSTPTTGSEVASLTTLILGNPQFSKMQAMRSEDYLGDLQRQWLNADLGIPSYCAYEKRKTRGLEIVTQMSAASLCTKRLDPIDSDHIDIVKPANRNNISYLAFKEAYQEQITTLHGGIFPPSAFQGVEANQVGPDELPTDAARRFESFAHEAGTQYTHFVSLHLNIGFRSDTYNTAPFLRSIAHIEAPASEISVVQSGKSLDADLFLHFSERPTGKVSLSIGPKKIDISLPGANWVEHREPDHDARPWWSAHFKATLTLDDPTWPVLREAKISPIVGGQKSYLEIIVDNRSGDVLPISDVIVGGSPPVHRAKPLLCASVPTERDWQPVVLNWRQLMGETQGEPAGVTQVEGHQLEVQATYTEYNCQGPANFLADIPTTYNIQPFTVQRLQFEIDELPINTGYTRNLRAIDFGGEVSPVLNQWQWLQVFLLPSGIVYPRGLFVRHAEENGSIYADDSIFRALNK